MVHDQWNRRPGDPVPKRVDRRHPLRNPLTQAPRGQVAVAVVAAGAVAGAGVVVVVVAVADSPHPQKRGDDPGQLQRVQPLPPPLRRRPPCGPALGPRQPHRGPVPLRGGGRSEVGKASP